MATKETAEKSSKNGSHKKLLITVAAVVIVLSVLFYLYETYGSIPSSLASTLSSGKPLDSAALQNILLQKVDAAKTFAVSYTGQIIINRDPPISFSFAKYYNDTRITLSLEDIPPIGNLSIILISNKLGPNGTLCIKADQGSAFNNIEGGNVSNGYRCVQTNSGSAQAQLINIMNMYINVSSLGGITTSSYGLTVHDGQPCYFVSGSGTINVNSTLIDVVSSAPQTPVGIHFNTCLSAQYNIPLNISANMTAANGSSIKISLDESMINQTTTAYEVDSLP